MMQVIVKNKPADIKTGIKVSDLYSASDFSGTGRRLDLILLLLTVSHGNPALITSSAGEH